MRRQDHLGCETGTLKQVFYWAEYIIIHHDIYHLKRLPISAKLRGPRDGMTDGVFLDNLGDLLPQPNYAFLSDSSP